VTVTGSEKDRNKMIWQGYLRRGRKCLAEIILSVKFLKTNMKKDGILGNSSSDLKGTTMSTKKADLCFYVRQKEMGSGIKARNIFSKRDFRKNAGYQTKSKVLRSCMMAKTVRFEDRFCF